MLAAEGLLLLQPFILGKTIDELILKNEYKWLITLFCVHMCANMFFYKRMVFDTKIYTKIYNDIVLKFVNKKDIDNSSKVARTDMSNQLVDVLESYVHYYISVFVTVIGSLYFIMSTNTQTGLIIISSAIFIAFAVLMFYKKIQQATILRNNHYEQKVDIINSEDEENILTFFKRRRKLLIMSSTIQGKNWFLISTIKHIFIIIAIVTFIKTSPNISQGSAIAIYAYINNFLESLMSIPVGVEAYSRIKDVINRIK